MKNRSTGHVHLVSAAAAMMATMLTASSVLGAAEDQALATAAGLVESTSSPGGVCVLVEPAEAELAVAISKQGSFTVQMLVRDDPHRDAAQRAIRAAGLYGQVSAGGFDGQRLPYTDNLVNLLVVDAFPQLQKDGLTPLEVIRVLAPLGVAWCGATSLTTADDGWLSNLQAVAHESGCDSVVTTELTGTWLRIEKRWPSDIDQWTHFLHGSDGNPVAEDRVVGPPKHYQWTGGPVWLRSHETDSSISTMVTAKGRLFAIVDEAPISVTGDHPLPDKWFLVARDAFNGVPLWKVPIRRWGWREWKSSWFATRPGDYPFDIRKRLVAVGDRVYVTLGYRAPVSELDARSGEVLRTFAETQNASELLLCDGKLYVSTHDTGKLRVMAVDLENGQSLWVTEKSYLGSTIDYLRWRSQYGSIRAPELSPAANLATDGRVLALIDGPQIVALDARSGTEKWRSPFPENQDDQFAGGIQAKGQLWNGTMIVRDGVVIHASPNALGTFSADTGDLLWVQPKKYIGHLWYEWKDVFVIGDLVWTWSAEFDQALIEVGRQSKQRQQWPRSANGYDLRSGELKQQVPVGNIFRTHHHHRCYRNKATLRYILASRRGTEFVDLQNGHHTVDNWVRGTCHVGMMPANGLQYVPPHPCQCYIEEKLTGMNVLASRLARADAPVPDQQRLQRGPAYGGAMGSVEADEKLAGQQWPAFRHDAARTGSVDTRVADDAQPLWQAELGGKLSAPTVADGSLFVSQVDQHHVICLDAQDGRKMWEFAAGARIDSPPTWHAGCVLFGSRDGWVYCLRAADGALVWRFLAAPCARWIGAFGQLESAWPVHGSVLVQDGTVYFAAGRSSQLDGGLFLYGLEVATGKLLYATVLDGPHYTVDNVEENYSLPTGSLPDILVGDGTRIFMRSTAFDSRLQPVRGQPAMQVDAGYLEDSYFKRTPWKMGAGNYGRVIVHDNRSAYYVRMFDSLRGLDPNVFFTPGKEGYLLFASNLGDNRDTWRTRIPVRIRAMVLAQDRLFVAGPPDVVDPQDPLGAFEGRKGGQLFAFDTRSGEKVAMHALASPPVFNGAAAASERLYIIDEQGKVTCYGSSASSSSIR